MLTWTVLGKPFSGSQHPCVLFSKFFPLTRHVFWKTQTLVFLTPLSELPLSCFMKKGMPFTHPESYHCAVPQGVQISGMPDKKTIRNTVVNEAFFDQGTMSSW